MRIDAHQHFWNYDPIRHEWIDDSMKVIRKNFLPSDLSIEMTKNGIDGTIAVQVDETEEENFFLLKLAEENEFIKGVVGWLDLRSAASEEAMAQWKKYKKMKGFRCIMQGKPDELYLKNDLFIAQVKKLASYEFTYDLLVYLDQLPSLIRFVEKLPDNKMILDHLGKPAIKNRELKNWKENIKILAQHPDIYCKLSGLVTEANHNNWSYDDLMPYLEIASEAFGIDRICFGSDWPVCLVAGSYSEVVGVIEKFSSQLNEQEKEKIFGSNTMKFYNLY
jgi:L-fuconolactonase